MTIRYISYTVNAENVALGLQERGYNEAEDCTYYLWPDGTTCYEEDLEDYLRFMSDDYIKITTDE
jgi:hypothetical protein